MRRLVPVVLTVLFIGLAPATAAPSTSAKIACSNVSMTLVSKVLGADATHITGPFMIGGESCSWHGDSPSCGMRSLSVRVDTAAAAGVRFARERRATVFREDLPGVGDSAFASADPAAFGAAVSIDRVDVLAGNRWTRLTLLGRFSPQITRPQLAEIARSGGFAT